VRSLRLLLIGFCIGSGACTQVRLGSDASADTDEKDGARPDEDGGAARDASGRADGDAARDASGRDDAGAARDASGSDDAGPVARPQDGDVPANDAGDAAGPSHDDSGGHDDSDDDGGTGDLTDGGTGVPPCQSGGLPNPQAFTVPQGGGRFDFCTMHGTIVRFDFPASAVGLEVTASSVDPQTHVWVNAGFSVAIEEAIDLQPPTSFSEPISVRLPDAAPLAFVFSANAGVPIPLERSTVDPSLLLLDRFGLLGIVDPDASCETDDGSTYANGFSDEADSGYCSGFDEKSTFRHYSCPRNPFCHEVTVGCCVDPGDTRTSCTTDDALVYHSYARANPMVEHAYCDGLGSTPYVQAVAPTTLIANYLDQSITLTGNNFQVGGYVFGGPVGSSWSGFSVSSTRLSDTTVTVTISGSFFTTPGEAINLGYANPWTSGPEYHWSRYSNAFIVPLSAPDVTCPIPGEGEPPLGQCGDTGAGCGCSVTFDPGDGPHDYQLSCDGSSCACKRDGVTLASTSQQVGGVCSATFFMLRQWKELCLHTPGFCP
jgi:hypothetical protein